MAAPTKIIERTPDREERAEGVAPVCVWFGPSVGPSETRHVRRFLGSHNGVAVLCWPRDAVEGRNLAQLGIPRLFVLDPARRRPEVGMLQDWIPNTAGLGDVYPRLVALAEQSARRRATSGRPTLDCDGWLHLGECRVELPAMIRGVAHGLLTHFGHPMDFVELARLCFCDFDRMHARLRWLGGCVAPLGLEVVVEADDRCVMRLCASSPRERA